MSLTSPTDNFECSDEEHERIGKKVQDVIDKFDTSTFKIDNKINFATSMCNMPVENSTHTTSTGRLLRGSTRKVTIAVKGGAVCRLCSTDNVDLNLRNDDNTFPSNAPAENTDIQNPPLILPHPQQLLPLVSPRRLQVCLVLPHPHHPLILHPHHRYHLGPLLFIP
jgi:hypothetical protein